VSAPLGLYIHIPFCQRKCPYCDFNTYAGLQSLHHDTIDALCLEMEHWAPRLSHRPVESIFLGGGTPTVLDQAQLGRLMAQACRSFALTQGCEITCEANPGTVDRQKFAILRDLGVNRLSLGVQSFQPQELEFLGRIHTVADVLAAVDAARSAGFDNINLDFMFGLPHQSLEAWDDTLTRALALRPEHLSLYSLIVEPNTPLYTWVESGRVAAPDDDVAARLYEHAQARLSAEGYLHYEVSNWARAAPGDEHRIMPARACRHNLIYWRNGEFLGVGPGAHSHLRDEDENGEPISRRWGNRKAVAGYVRSVRQKGQKESVEEFSEVTRGRLSMGETMMLGLRLVHEGVEHQRFQALHRHDLREVYPGELRDLERCDLIECTEERVRLTARGLMLGNQVFARFLPESELTMMVNLDHSDEHSAKGRRHDSRPLSGHL
jgi:oxygen-independent coproporphyrinogen-3 oxidase